MTTPTKKRVVKTPFDQLLAVMQKHWNEPLAGRCTFDAEQLESIKAMASELPLTDVVEDVPETPKTDGELWVEAWRTEPTNDAAAAKFLRLLRERDGEPLDVTKEIIADWYMEWRADQDTPRQSEWFVFLTAKINAHRGVRSVPQIPQVTAEMCKDAVNYTWRNIPSCSPSDMADFINAELAKQAGKVGELCQ